MNIRCNRLFLVVAAFLAAGPLATAATAVGLKEAVARSVNNQPLILQAEAAVEAARAVEGQAKSAYLPTVAGVASAVHVEPQIGIDQSFDIPNLGSMEMKEEESPLNALDFHLGASELVFDFGRREIQVRLASSGAGSAAISLEQIQSNIAYQAASLFYSVLFLEREVGVLDEQLATLGQHLDDAQKREDTGSSTHYDVLTTQVRVATVRSQRIDAAGQLAKQKIALGQIMGLREGEDFEAEGDFAPMAAPGTPSALLSAAYGQRQDIALSRSAEKQAEMGVSLAELGHAPTLLAQAQAGFKNGELTFDNADIDKLVFAWNVGLVLNVPIFDGMLTEGRIAEARSRLEAARSGTEAASRSARTQVLQALRDLETSREQTANSRAQLDQAQEALGMAKVQYDIGAGTNLQYLDSQTSLELAKLTSLGASYKEEMSALALRQALGDKLWEEGR